MKNHIIWNPEQIRIPRNTLVAICGITNSGKSTLSDKYFTMPEVAKITTDKILNNCINYLVSSLKHSLDVTPDSMVWDEISQSLSRVAILSARDIMLNQVVAASYNSITVLDSVGTSLETRLSTLNFVAKSFDHIYLMVLNPPLEKVLEREPKTISEAATALGFKFPDSAQLARANLELKLQISNGTISKGVEKAFIIKNPDNLEFIFNN